MTRSAVFVACSAISCLGIAFKASAEPVTITGGSMVFSTGDMFQAGPISLTGTRGFSLQGDVLSGEGTVPGLGCCFFPGETLGPTRGRLSGNAWRADATLDGQTFPNVGSADTLNPFLLDLFVTMIVPELQASPVTVPAPFTAIGHLSRVDPNLPPLNVSVRGSGKVSVTFVEVALGAWNSGGVRYDFTQPTPEPATLMLVSGGVVAAAARVRKRRSAEGSAAC
jgi:hypothetical protein